MRQRRCRDRAGAALGGAGHAQQDEWNQRRDGERPRIQAARRRAPSGGSHSHRPSQDTARNRPTAVASVASAGHSRSQKIVQRARRNALPSSNPAAASAL